MVHTFSYTYHNKPYYFLWDIESASLHNVDETAYLCAKNKYSSLSGEEFFAYRKIDAETLVEIETELSELEKDGTLNTKPLVTEFKKQSTILKALCLHICHDCNLKCKYCFASGGTYKTAKDYMTLDIGKKAIDLLITNSGSRQNLEVDFFGGEPLMNLDIVKDIVSYAKEEAAKHNKIFSFTMTTNCILLDNDTIEYLNREMENVVLSIDGRENTHNCVRKTINDKDSYKLVLERAKAFANVRGSKKYYVRGTFTSNNLDFSEDICKLNDEGFNQISIEPVVLPSTHELSLKEEHLDKMISEYEKLASIYIDRRKNGKWFNFFHFMIDLEHGPCINKRLTGCGAGTEYLAVSPIGEIYPCHQFVGEKDYLIGSVYDGIQNQAIREKFGAANLLTKQHCKDCPAKYYCGGGCAANAKNFSGDLNGCYELGCELMKKRLELSLAINTIERE